MYMLIVSEILIFGAFSWRGSTLTPLAVRSPGRLSRVDGLAGGHNDRVVALGSLTARVRSDRSRRGGRPEQTRAGICHDCRNRRAVPRGACVRMVEPAGRGTQVDNGSLRGNLLRTGRTARWSPIAGLVLFGIVIYRARVRDHFSANRNLMVRTAEAYWHFLTAILDRDIHLHLLRHHLTNQLHHLFRSHDHSTTVGTETTDTECAGHEPAGSPSARRLSSRRSPERPHPSSMGRWPVRRGPPATASGSSRSRTRRSLLHGDTAS